MLLSPVSSAPSAPAPPPATVTRQVADMEFWKSNSNMPGSDRYERAVGIAGVDKRIDGTLADAAAAAKDLARSFDEADSSTRDGRVGVTNLVAVMRAGAGAYDLARLRLGDFGNFDEPVRLSKPGADLGYPANSTFIDARADLELVASAAAAVQPSYGFLERLKRIVS